MELRPGPFAQKLAKGYLRMSNRRWIKDPGHIEVPDHIARMSSAERKTARAESKSRRAEYKKSPVRPAPLDSGFYEPEIYTTSRRSGGKPYLQRQVIMDPTSSGQVQNQSDESFPCQPITGQPKNDQAGFKTYIMLILTSF